MSKIPSLARLIFKGSFPFINFPVKGILSNRPIIHVTVHGLRGSKLADELNRLLYEIQTVGRCYVLAEYEYIGTQNYYGDAILSYHLINAKRLQFFH